MKNNLGKIFVLLLISLHVELFAAEYEWSSSINKSSAYIDEAITLKYICKFNNTNDLYTIDFNPVVDNKRYTIKLLKESEKIVDGKRFNSYEYIAFAKQSGVMIFDFEIIMKKTTQESIDAITGGRDNDRDIESFSKTYLDEQSLKISIKDTPTSLVGDLTLKVKKEKSEVYMYEPYHLELEIIGIANFESIKPINFNIKDVKVFSQKPIKNIKLTKNGYRGVWSQKFAFVAKNNFIIPKVTMKFFDIKDNITKELILKKIDIIVTPKYKKEQLLDDDLKETKWKFNYEIFYYILTYIAGFMMAKVSFKKRKKDKVDVCFKTKIKKCKSLEELMMILVLQDSVKYKNLIYDIETKKITSLSRCKKILQD